MSRFQIEDIVEQDKHGVVFRAHDVESGRIVSLRRFLLFGQDGGGLEKEEALAFENASERLAGLSHVALRSVITGSADPIDGIPYLVTEWVEGMSLSEVLAGESMDPALVIDVLRIALEVSIVLSEVLGEEAVWVETEVASIIIGTKDSGRGFTFWISPFKWLGAQFGSRKLSSIVELGEELAGWKGKLVSDQAGSGLGGWLKWLKKNPDASLGEALEMLKSSTGNVSPPPEVKLMEGTKNPPSPLPKQSTKKIPLIVAAAVVLLLISATLLYLRRDGKASSTDEKSLEHADSGIVRTGTLPSDPDPAAPSQTNSSAPQTAADRASALARKMSATAAKDKPKPTPAPPKPKPAKPQAGAGEIFSPEDRALFASIKVGTPVKLRGTLRSTKASSTGKSIYLNFSDPPDPDKLGGVAHLSNFNGVLKAETFAPQVGKTVLVSGTFFKEPSGKMYVKILSAEQVQPAK